MSSLTVNQIGLETICQKFNEKLDLSSLDHKPEAVPLSHQVVQGNHEGPHNEQYNRTRTASYTKY